VGLSNFLQGARPPRQADPDFGPLAEQKPFHLELSNAPRDPGSSVRDISTSLRASMPSAMKESWPSPGLWLKDTKDLSRRSDAGDYMELHGPLLPCVKSCRFISI